MRFDKSGLELLRDTRSSGLETLADIILKGEKYAED
jgi:hypothetical protein